ncbi:hypothetical protein HY993_01015 [Candidatus Micrarchaeota archaeon]|nr:hypothetical protein [Candidatus Micrarchaeota archaeon]
MAGSRSRKLPEKFGPKNKYYQKIFSSKDGPEKIRKIKENQSGLRVFSGFHLHSITLGTGWQAKLDWLTENHQQLATLGFNGSHISQIFRNKGWDEKTKWLTKDYSKYSKHGLTPLSTVSVLVTKDWKDRTSQWQKNKALLPLLQVTDSRISPFAERHLIATFFMKSPNRARKLLESCDYDELERIQEKIRGTGLGNKKTRQEVLEGVKKLGFDEDVVKLLLTAKNHNIRELAKLYVDGDWSTAAVSAEQLKEKGVELADNRSTEEIALKKMATESVLKKIRENHPEDYGFWRKFIAEKGSDLEELSEKDRKEFNQCLGRLHKDKTTMAEIYQLLKD